MPAKRSSTSGALSWILAVVLVSVAAIGVGWLLGHQVLNWLNQAEARCRKPTQQILATVITMGEPGEHALPSSTTSTSSSGTLL